ncbi:MAG: hypothetical protein ACREAC_04265, partial [Blastocatellia bacterium]
EGRRTGYNGINTSGQVCAPSQLKNPLFWYTLTQLTFRTGDGTEYNFRDQATDGAPASVNAGTVCADPNHIGASRGTVWVSTGGEAATFVSDSVINDQAVSLGTAAQHLTTIFGVLMLKDGTQYRIDNGLVSWIRDRNGNSITFAYDTSSRVTTIVSSLGTMVTISYKLTDPVLGKYDQISYSGFANLPRTIKIFKYANLDTALRDSTASVQTPTQLFPDTDSLGNLLMNGASSVTNFDPSVVTKVVLPDGVRSYNFFYNPFAELTRVVLPTGGAIDYEMTSDSGIITQEHPVPDVRQTCLGTGEPVCDPIEIYRRCVRRTMYPNGPGTTPEGAMAFDAVESGDSLSVDETITTITHYASDGKTVLAKYLHYFHGAPTAGMLIAGGGYFYPKWDEGKEFQTDLVDPARGTLKSTVSLFQQALPEPAVSWWTAWAAGPPGTKPLDVSAEPPQNPQLASTTTTLVDTGLVSFTSYQYDQFNNVTDESDYDFRNGAHGPLLREVSTQYFHSNSDGLDYNGPSNGIHIRDLPAMVQVMNGSVVSETYYEYDNYTPEMTPPGTQPNHAVLKDCPGL